MSMYKQDQNGDWWYYNKQQRAKATMFNCKECEKIFPRLKGAVKDPLDVFCSRQCANKETARIHRITRRGAGSPTWKGGRRLTTEGYIRIYYPNHPNAEKTHGTIMEHRLVMEQMIGRYLTTEETVHHKNGIRNDNRPENLELWSGNHPATQRVEDLITWAYDILHQYRPELLTTQIKDVLIPKTITHYVFNNTLKIEYPELLTKQKERPSKEKLAILLWKYPMTYLSEYFQISDQCVKKWAISYSLSIPPKHYWTKEKRIEYLNDPLF